MTKQKAFNRVWDWFIVRGNPASIIGTSVGNMSCRYRTKPEDPNSPRCAFGIFIPDQFYCPSMEGLAVGALLSSRVYEEFHKACFPYITAETSLRSNIIQLLISMQCTHDYAARAEFADSSVNFTQNMRTRLTSLAANFNLSIPPEGDSPNASQQLSELSSASATPSAAEL